MLKDWRALGGGDSSGSRVPVSASDEGSDSVGEGTGVKVGGTGVSDGILVGETVEVSIGVSVGD